MPCTVIGTGYNMMYVRVLTVPVRVEDDFDRFDIHVCTLILEHVVFSDSHHPGFWVIR